MGKLDEPRFEALLRDGCACGNRTFDITSYIDRSVGVMLGDPNDGGKWAHDGEKFVDGIYRIACTACQRTVFEDADCPRCHAPGTLAATLTTPSSLQLPKRCPGCQELELVALALVPATARWGGGEPPRPRPLVDLLDPGAHWVAFACETCDAATVTQRCPLCDAPGPLRPRP
jgi:hypothetical protein